MVGIRGLPRRSRHIAARPPLCSLAQVVIIPRKIPEGVPGVAVRVVFEGLWGFDAVGFGVDLELPAAFKRAHQDRTLVRVNQQRRAYVCKPSSVLLNRIETYGQAVIGLIL